jgi:hypothetical protein
MNWSARGATASDQAGWRSNEVCIDARLSSFACIKAAAKHGLGDPHAFRAQCSATVEGADGRRASSGRCRAYARGRGGRVAQR